MIKQRQAIDLTATSLMVVLCFIWSLAQISLKYTAPDMAPILQISLRSIGAIVLIALMVFLRQQPLFTIKKGWMAGLVIGALFAGEYYLLGEALRLTLASHATVFLYTAPLFAALGLHIFTPDERLRPLQWGGILMAFTGIAISFYGHDESINSELSPNVLLGDLLALLAGLFWGATTVVVRSSRLQHATATETLFYQLAAAFILLLSGAFLTDQMTITWSKALLGSLFFQIVIVSFSSFLIWFWLLRKYLASRLGVLSFMTPLFGVILGVVLLDESLEKNFIFGTVCVVLGILLVTGQEWLNKNNIHT